MPTNLRLPRVNRDCDAFTAQEHARFPAGPWQYSSPTSSQAGSFRPGLRVKNGGARYLGNDVGARLPGDYGPDSFIARLVLGPWQSRRGRLLPGEARKPALRLPIASAACAAIAVTGPMPPRVAEPSPPTWGVVASFRHGGLDRRLGPGNAVRYHRGRARLLHRCAGLPAARMDGKPNRPLTAYAVLSD